MHASPVEQGSGSQQQLLVAAGIQGKQHGQQGDEQQLHGAVGGTTGKAQQLPPEGLQAVPAGSPHQLQLQGAQLGNLAGEGMQPGRKLGDEIAEHLDLFQHLRQQQRREQPAHHGKHHQLKNQGSGP